MDVLDDLISRLTQEGIPHEVVPNEAGSEYALHAGDGHILRKFGTRWLYIGNDGRQQAGHRTFAHDEEAARYFWLRVSASWRAQW